MTYGLIRLLHLLSVLILGGAIVIENIAVKPKINAEDAHNLAKVDRVAGIAALFAVILGSMLWFGVGKPVEFYNANPVFHAKISLFVLLLFCASYPAFFFNKHRATQRSEIDVPKSVIRLLKIEIALMLVMPLLAFMMARGVGL